MSDAATTQERMAELQQRSAAAMQAFSQTLRTSDRFPLAGVPVLGRLIRKLVRIYHIADLGYRQEMALQSQFDQIQALVADCRDWQARQEEQTTRIDHVTAQISYLPISMNTLIGELRQEVDHVSNASDRQTKP